MEHVVDDLMNKVISGGARFETGYDRDKGITGPEAVLANLVSANKGFNKHRTYIYPVAFKDTNRVAFWLSITGIESQRGKEAAWDILKRRAEILIKALNEQQATCARLDDEALRDLWREAGGEFHGPTVETGTMPEEKLLPFLRRMALTNYVGDRSKFIITRGLGPMAVNVTEYGSLLGLDFDDVEEVQAAIKPFNDYIRILLQTYSSVTSNLLSITIQSLDKEAFTREELANVTPFDVVNLLKHLA